MKLAIMMITVLAGLSSPAHAYYAEAESIDSIDGGARPVCETRAIGYNISGYSCTNVGYTDRYGSDTYSCSGGGSTWVLYGAGSECHAVKTGNN